MRPGAEGAAPHERSECALAERSEAPSSDRKHPDRNTGPDRGPMGHDDYSLPMASTTTDARWRALVSRDLTADGTFVYGVASTGVYCRPSCPSRRPRPNGVLYFQDRQTPSAPGIARAAGAGRRMRHRRS